MKKIIALVLCLVMALSLCAVASAYEVTTIKAANFSAVDASGAAVLKTASTITYRTESTSVTDGVTTITAPFFTVDGVEYTVCDKTCATYIFTANGVDYYVTGANQTVESSSKVATNVVIVTKTSGFVCGDYKVSYVVIDGKTYELDADFSGTTTAFYNGKAVGYGDLVSPVAHSFTSILTSDVANDTYTAKCTVCKEVVTLQKTAGKFDGQVWVSTSIANASNATAYAAAVEAQDDAKDAVDDYTVVVAELGEKFDDAVAAFKAGLVNSTAAEVNAISSDASDWANYFVWGVTGGNNLRFYKNSSDCLQAAGADYVMNATETDLANAAIAAAEAYVAAEDTLVGLQNTYVAAKAVVDNFATAATTYYYVAGQITSTAASTAAAATTVSSAKTFDAGVAMYVGMSIMAAAGSAVVIGKKKEF